MPDADLDELDARLAALGVDLDDVEADAVTFAELDWTAGAGPDAQLVLDVDAAPELLERRELLGDEDLLDHEDLLEDLRLDLTRPSAPPGYRLDARSTLRYDHDGAAVPGQQRVTLARRWRFERSGDDVLVPAMHVEAVADLAWCAKVASPTTSTRVGAQTVAAYAVPAPLWDAMASTVLAVTAPELSVDSLVGVTEVADLTGLSRDSVRTYLVRGTLPPPVARVGSTPLWSVPVVLAWSAARRQPGRQPA